MKLPTLLFATERYEELGEDIAGAGDFGLGVVERKVFPDQERYRRIETDCARRDVVLVEQELHVLELLQPDAVLAAQRSSGGDAGFEDQATRLEHAPDQMIGDWLVAEVPDAPPFEDSALDGVPLVEVPVLVPGRKWHLDR